MNEKELLKLSIGEIIDKGVCPTCLNKKFNGVLYGDNKDKLFYNDDDIECFFVGNPRSEGHICISSTKHFKDMSEAPDALNEKIFRFAKQLMIIVKNVFKCEQVYLCTMCDGLMNHYHIQLIPRYKNEKRGSQNFVKERKSYIYNEEKFKAVKTKILNYASKIRN